MREQSLAFLRTLLNTPESRPGTKRAASASGWITSRRLPTKPSLDAYGNCVAVLNKGGSPRLMLAGARR